MTSKEKLIIHCPDPAAKRRLAAMFGLELQRYLTWSAPKVNAPCWWGKA